MIVDGMEMPDEVYELFEKLRVACYEAAEALKNMFRNVFTDDIVQVLHKIVEEYSALLMRSPREKRLRPDYKSNLLAGRMWRAYERNLRKQRYPYQRRVF